ncbi:hypothetical protein LGQ02_03280 [Bacillus shivajii]|uniref:hypothetical protein n=1 Tax=Bacillus shivajii TaxID=1983719 RepID=UPI001CFB5827|nr:hypothetical protein [Bacillus shivajii]UCZ53823.1 hypothetical protein LGQ02_03280 [Bacillus shivajii]
MSERVFGNLILSLAIGVGIFLLLSYLAVSFDKYIAITGGFAIISSILLWIGITLIDLQKNDSSLNHKGETKNDDEK